MSQNNHNNNKGYLKRRILIPLAVVIILTVAAFGIATIWHVRSAIDREAESQVHFAAQTYDGDIESDARQMAALLELITNDAAIRRALERGDREALLALAAPYYRPLNSDLHITHFYFSTPDRVNLLRVHNPPRNGDRIDRFTTLEAERSGAIAYGVELGVLGTFTLRVVKPWYHDGKLLGYVELGEEIDHVVDKLRHTLNIGLFVFINKQYLERGEWEKGMRMLGREGEWKRYPAHILVNAPPRPGTIPAPLVQQLYNSRRIIFNQPFDVSVPSEYYKATFLPLEDVRGHRVGMILLMSPQEHWFIHGRNTILGALLFFLFIGGGVFTLFYRLADDTEKVLDNTARMLREEVDENEYLHARHIHNLEEQNSMLEVAAAEIEANQERLEAAQRIAHIGSWEWDIPSGELSWSDEVFRIFGYRPGEIEATYPAFLNVIHPDDRKTVALAVQEALQSGSSYDVEHRIVRPGGEERIVRERGEIDYDAEKHPLRMIGTVHDITQRKKAEQLSRQLGHILDNASNEIYLIAPDDLQIVEVNHTAARRLSYALPEFEALSYLEVAVDLDRKRFDELAAPLLSGESSEVCFESRHRCKSGENYPVEIRLQLSDLDNQQLYIAMVLDISERLEQALALKHQAMHDILTDLPNRVLLAEQMEHEVARARRKQESVTLLQINIDDFGAINDTLGHDNGDRLLQQLAERLKNHVRQADTVARIGGDEFAVLMPDAAIDELEALQGQLQQALRRPYQIGDYSLSIETATGIAVFPDHADNTQELMQHADVALKRAKAFHSVTEIYRPDYDPFSVRRLVLSSHMRSAIDRGEFELYFQPKVEAASGRLRGAEALIRWQHSEQGFISPAEFIPLAEKTGYIRQITLWVIDEAARFLSEWGTLASALSVSVNLSARNLQDPELLSYITEITGKYGVAPQQLGFEVTETAVMLDPDYTQNLLQQLNLAGHPIAIDDYGTGYSSLAYIHRLPVDELKIDSSFTLDMLSNEDSMLIVRSTVELAHNLNLRVTAEGVESEAQMEELKRMGADLLQGFYFSRPVPAGDFMSLLQARAGFELNES